MTGYIVGHNSGAKQTLKIFITHSKHGHLKSFLISYSWRERKSEIPNEPRKTKSIGRSG